MSRQGRPLFGLLVMATVLAQMGPDPAVAQEPPRLSTPSIAHAATPATVTILARSADGDTLAQGSGFLLRSDGVIVTNWHVMVGASSAVIILATQERFDRVGFLDGDSAADIALLKIPGYHLPTLRPANALPEVGEKVVVIGSPLGLSRTVSEGIVSATRLFNGRRLMQMTAPISPGSSGGPVLDTRGRVVAVATSYLEGAQQVNFAVPVNYALGLVHGAAAERDLADVFGQLPIQHVQSGRVPTPAKTIRASLMGLYRLAFRASSAATGQPLRRRDRYGWIVITEDGLGWATFVDDSAQVDAPDPAAGVSSVRVGSVSPTGQILVSMPRDFPYDGYQTEDGFYLTRRDTLQGYGAVNSAAVATAALRRLSDPTGLYKAHASNQFHYRGQSTPFAEDWSGQAAVAVANDSIYIALVLRPRGTPGEAGAIMGGVIGRDGRFNASYHHSGGLMTLKGRLLSGEIVGEWIDDRLDEGKFEGPFAAERQ